MFNWFNTPYPFSAAEIRAFADGTVHLLTMAADIGQGSDTVLKQILAEELGLTMEDIRITSGDTAMTPQADLGSWGSRVTLMAGNAVIDAAKKIKAQLFGAVSARFNLNVIYEMECRNGRVQAKGRPDKGVSFGEAVAMVQKANRGEPLVARGSYTPRDKGLVTPAFGFGAQVAQVEVDQETGLVEVKQMWTAHDCGTVINPRAVEGQLAGSIQMGLGYALSRAVRHGRRENAEHQLPGLQDAQRPGHAAQRSGPRRDLRTGRAPGGQGMRRRSGLALRPRPSPMRSITPPATGARICPSRRRRFCKAMKK